MEMSYKYREELVGKRFLSISGVPKLSVSKISDWGWKAGVIRASSHKDNKNKDLQVLVEYDGEGWRRRQWLQVYGGSFSVFLVEEELVWAPKGAKPFPALKFIALKSISLGSRKPVEFLIDHELIFIDGSELEDFKSEDWESQGEAGQAARRWARRQQAQRVLSRCPAALGGCRAQVYRARGATQWYTAVIVGCNQETGELTLTDDTVLEEHNEDPALVQMRLLGDGVVESIMRGETVGMLPRRSRSGAQHAKFESQTTRVSSRTATRTKKPSALLPALQHNEKGSKRKKKKRKASDKFKLKSKVIKKVISKKEDIENKKKKRSESFSPRKKVLLVDDVSNKIRDQEKEEDKVAKVQQVQLEEESDVVVIVSNNTEVVDNSCSNSNCSNSAPVPTSEESTSTSATSNDGSTSVSDPPAPVVSESVVISNSEVLPESEVVVEESAQRREKEEEDSPISEEGQPSEGDAVEIARETEASPQPLEDAARMEDGGRFPDDRSDSGVSSLRSASGDERSGSRSSALSVPEEHDSPRGMAHPAGPSPAPASVAPRAPPHMPQQMPAHIQPHLHYPPPLLHLPPPDHYTHHDLIWTKRYQDDYLERDRILRNQQLLRGVPFTEADLMLSDSSQRLFSWHRERQREQEVRELENQQIKERERIEREQREQIERERERERERAKAEREQEKERQEKAVHKHFEDSLRLANQKRERTPTWSLFNSLTPPGRGGQAPPPQPTQLPLEDQRGLSNDRLRASAEIRDRNYYNQQPLQQRPSSVPSKNDYPPPAHSRLTLNPKPLEKSSMHIGLPKAEPNFNIYNNYSNYHPPVGYINHDSKPKQEHLSKVQLHKNSVNKTLSSVGAERDSVNSLPTPPPLVSEMKNSVIVKHEAKLPTHHLEIKSHAVHSPKLRGGEVNAYYHSTVNPSLVSYRGAPPQSQPPPQRGCQSLPPASRPRQEPYSRPPTGHTYHLPPGAPLPVPTKPKVSSPAPPHFYGKPTSGITSGIPVCRSQEPPVAVNAIPLTSKANSPGIYRPPPPAHSRGDPRPLIPPGASPPAAYPAPQPMAYQTQPLDLGISSDRDDGERSPKRRGTPIQNLSDSLSLEKKRKLEPTGPPFQMESIQQYPAANTSPQLSRVSEPTPLIASAATTITTMVNIAAYCTSPAPRAHTDSPVRIPSADGAVRPPSVPRPVEKIEPELSTTPAPPVLAPCPSPLPPVTPVKVPSPPVAGSPKDSGPPVRHLKKAWLQRHETAPEPEKETAPVVAPPTTTTTATPTVTPVIRPSETLSLQNVGSMAVNSIIRSKPIKVARKAQKETNGHLEDSQRLEYSSSSDQERNSKGPPKRKPPKVKRKKGGGGKKSSSDDGKKKKNSLVSESGSESDKESNSDKDSDSGASLNHSISVKKSTNGSSSSSSNGTACKDKEPRKRGRRPKSSKGDKSKDDDDEPIRNKKSKDDPPNPTFPKLPVSQLKKTGESFLQDGTCYDVAPKLAKCRECRWTPNQRSKNMSNIFCRFYAFRKLRYTKNGQLAIAGFSDPNKDPTEEDIKLWLQPAGDCVLDIEMSCFLLKQIGDQFCDLLLQESETKSQNLNEDKTIAWKRVVQGTREMCDVCETTIFNYHWACGKCGFMVCLDCYKSRSGGTCTPVPGISGAQAKERDEYGWLTCTSRAAHDVAKLMLTQIVAGDVLMQAGKKLHQTRKLWGVPQGCECKDDGITCSPTQARVCRKLLREAVLENFKKMKEDEKKNKDITEGDSPKNRSTSISWLAGVALKSEDKDGDDSTSSDSDGEGNFSTLRELLIRPNKPSSGSSSPSSTNGRPSKKSKTDILDDVISRVTEKDDVKYNELDSKPFELKHFVRRHHRSHASGRDQLPIRMMTYTESSSLYPDTPHSWLCDGKLLRLTDPHNPGNYRIFQDQWKRGQPVIVSDLMKFLDKDLWTPDSFSRDFGEEKNDLINCLTGKIVPNQPMKKFWDGFDHTSKRLKDDKGDPMLLKLKDWPPGEDFADLLPTRFSNFMKCLPLQEYTHRNGKLNLASRLPESFVRPDLGPKMYTAYGSALYPGYGTTNLHLDVSDAVNVTVHVSGPKDVGEKATREAFRAIDEAGCDILTRRRVREKGEIPGALWHIYNPRDADKIRDLLNKIAIEKGEHPQPHHDPIHDQSCYLDAPLRERLYKDYRVEGYAIVQCLGDAVFIPAGAPHQVRNLNDCIKVAEDFVSPENISHCFHLTQEFRDLTDTHTNHEDKLQIKNIIYHAVKDSLDCLQKSASLAPDTISSTEFDSKEDIKKEALP